MRAGLSPRGLSLGCAFGSGLLVALAATWLHAHESPDRTSRQHYRIQIDPRNINIEVSTRFFGRRRESPAGIEADSAPDSVRIDPEALARATAGHLRLQVDGRSVPLYRLHQPELETAGPAESPEPRFLKLTFFARTPAWLREGSQINLQNALTGQSHPESVFQIEGLDGIRLATGEQPRQMAGTEQGLLSFAATVVAGSADSARSAPAVEEASVPANWTSRLLPIWALLTLGFAIWRRAFRRKAEKV